MNYKRYKISDDLKKEFHIAFKLANDKKIFLFFHKFLKFIENDDSPYNISLYFSNPRHDEENKQFMKCFNRTCKDFLESKIAEKKDPEKKYITGQAMCFIGVGHEYGLFGYQKDYNAAYEHYIIAAQLHDGMGTYKLAQSHELGKGTDRDLEKAVYFYRCAAKLGLTDALHTYGSILIAGYLGVDIDEKTGLHYLSLASIKADEIYPYPLFDIGRWYEKKKEDQDGTSDEAYSFQVYFKGATLGDPNCQYRVAKCLGDGELGQQKNLARSIEWYKKAAELGQIDAQIKLFDYYYSGISGILRRDPQISYFWALRAGTKGCPRAVFYLGEFSLNGTGVKKDMILALWWYKIASTMGSREGKIKYNEILEEVKRRDIGPQIPSICCGYLFCCYF